MAIQPDYGKAAQHPAITVFAKLFPSLIYDLGGAPKIDAFATLVYMGADHDALSKFTAGGGAVSITPTGYPTLNPVKKNPAVSVRFLHAKSGQVVAGFLKTVLQISKGADADLIAVTLSVASLEVVKLAKDYEMPTASEITQSSPNLFTVESLSSHAKKMLVHGATQGEKTYSWSDAPSKKQKIEGGTPLQIPISGPNDKVMFIDAAGEVGKNHVYFSPVAKKKKSTFHVKQGEGLSTPAIIDFEEVSSAMDALAQKDIEGAIKDLLVSMHGAVHKGKPAAAETGSIIPGNPLTLGVDAGKEPAMSQGDVMTADLKTAPKVNLRDATMLMQRVYGTDKSSTYYAVALSKGLKMALRVAGLSASIRIEGADLHHYTARLTASGLFTVKSNHASGHHAIEHGVKADMYLGAALAVPGVAWESAIMSVETFLQHVK